jgi:isopentenyl phosphate kinase
LPEPDITSSRPKFTAVQHLEFNPYPFEAMLVKLGGAAISQKHAEEPTLDSEGVDACVRSLKALHASSILLAIAHGAGSYAHPVAKRTNAASGWSPSSTSPAPESSSRRLGWCRARAGVDSLSATLLDQALSEPDPIPMTLLSPCPLGFRKHHVAPPQRSVAELSHCCRSGIVPLLRGDGVFDENRCGLLLSADDVVLQLARSEPFSSASCVVFVTGVEGVLASPSSSSLASDILCSNGRPLYVRWVLAGEPPQKEAHDPSFWTTCKTDNWSDDLRETSDGIDFFDNGVDSTGGMRAKMAAAMTLAEECNVKVVIVNPTNFERLAHGAPFRGTTVEAGS